MVVLPTSPDQLSDEATDRIFRALADATRRDIILRTMTHGVSVSDLASAYDMSFAAVQKHVAVLEGAGLVSKNPVGRTRLVSAEPAAIAHAQALLSRYESVWTYRIDQLDELLASDTSASDTSASNNSASNNNGRAHRDRPNTTLNR